MKYSSRLVEIFCEYVYHLMRWRQDPLLAQCLVCSYESMLLVSGSLLFSKGKKCVHRESMEGGSMVGYRKSNLTESVQDWELEPFVKFFDFLYKFKPKGRKDRLQWMTSCSGFSNLSYYEL